MIVQLVYCVMILLTACLLCVIALREFDPEDDIDVIIVGALCVLFSISWPFVLPAIIVGFVGQKIVEGDMTIFK